MAALVRIWDSLKRDLRYAARMLLTRPGFTAVAVLSIALGIGATTAIFSVVYAVLVDPYPYRAADRIGSMGATTSRGDWRFDYTMAQYLVMKERLRSTEDEVAVTLRRVVLTGKGLLPEVVSQESSSPNMFEFFGVPPLIGRAFTSADFPAGKAAEPVALISYKFWQHTFQGSRDVLGRTILLNDKPYTVIGVLPVRFTWNDADAYTAMTVRPSMTDYVDVFFRIRKGITARQISTEFTPLLAEFKKQLPAYEYPDEHFTPKWISVNEGILGKFATTLLVLFGAVFLLLLIACGNVANLLLARAATRGGEMAVRQSIGATRRHIVSQLLTESVLLALTGGAIGIGMAFLGVKAVVALMPEYSIPHEAVIALNWPVLWFAVAVSVLTGILFGLAPAFHASSTAGMQALKGSGRGAAVSRGRRRFHDALMVLELTLSLVLLTGTGLAVKGLLTLQKQKLGYNPDGVLTFLLPLGEGRYSTWETRTRLYTDVLERLSRIPGVRSVAMSESGPPPYNGFDSKLTLEGVPVTGTLHGRVNPVSGEYSQLVQSPLLRGRYPTPAELERGSPVALISDDLVKRYFQRRDPIGRHVQVDLFNQTIPPQILKGPRFVSSFEVIGVVGTARNRGLAEQADPAMFIPYTILCAPNNLFLIRATGDPLALETQARQAVRAIDSHQAITMVRTLGGWLDQATAYPRFATFLFGVFGAVGILLAAAGVFSVVSYGVAYRTREFGIRMALGALPIDVLRLVVLNTSRMLAVGVAAGLVLSVCAVLALANKMEGMGTADVSLFVATSAVLIAVTLIGSFVPARAATMVQPMDALRHE